jgi:hypothetical protein
MAKTLKVTWLGDEDPGAQIIRIGDLRFIKGEATDVPDDHEHAEMLRTNPLFTTEANAQPTAADESVSEALAAQAEDGTERGALKAQLRAMGHDVRGNPSVETLRARLADATK